MAREQKLSLEEKRMTIEEMKKRKKELGYTYDQISELSGVPLGTVQKIFAGFTESPRYDTLKALEKGSAGTGDADLLGDDGKVSVSGEEAGGIQSG